MTDIKQAKAEITSAVKKGIEDYLSTTRGAALRAEFVPGWHERATT